MDAQQQAGSGTSGRIDAALMKRMLGAEMIRTPLPATLAEALRLLRVVPGVNIIQVSINTSAQAFFCKANDYLMRMYWAAGVVTQNITRLQHVRMHAVNGQMSTYRGARVAIFAWHAKLRLRWRFCASKGTADAKEQATASPRRLVLSLDCRMDITSGGAIDPLVQVVRHGNSIAKEHVALTQFSLTEFNDRNRVTLAAADAISPLVALLGSGTVDAKENDAAMLQLSTLRTTVQYLRQEASRLLQSLPVVVVVYVAKDHAAAALTLLALNCEHQVDIATNGGIGPLIALAHSGTGIPQDYALRALKHLSANPASQAAVKAAGAILPWVELLSGGSGITKEDAAGTLSRLAINASTIWQPAAVGIAPSV
eukprot:6201280-Pleurochrysis_carterae.AAC.11